MNIDRSVLVWGARILCISIMVWILWVIYKKKYELAPSNSGHFLSKFHDNTLTIAQQVVEYAENPFQVTQSKVYQKPTGRWKHEEKCRQILERIFHKPFPSVRPDWLKSPMTGKNLELDCYNQELRIALEYNGRQHYVYTPYFHKTRRDFHAQVHRDNWKRKRCRERGIHLIEIPYTVPENELEAFIRRKL